MKRMSILLFLTVLAFSSYSQDKLTSKEKKLLNKVGLIIAQTQPNHEPASGMGLYRLTGGIAGIPADLYYTRSDHNLEILNAFIDQIDPYNVNSKNTILEYLKGSSGEKISFELITLDKEFQELISDTAEKKSKTDVATVHLTTEMKMEKNLKKIENRENYKKVYDHLKENGYDGLAVIRLRHWAALGEKLKFETEMTDEGAAFLSYNMYIYNTNNELIFHYRDQSKEISTSSQQKDIDKYNKFYTDFISNALAKSVKELY